MSEVGWSASNPAVTTILVRSKSRRRRSRNKVIFPIQQRECSPPRRKDGSSSNRKAAAASARRLRHGRRDSAKPQGGKGRAKPPALYAATPPGAVPVRSRHL